MKLFFNSKYLLHKLAISRKKITSIILTLFFLQYFRVLKVAKLLVHNCFWCSIWQKQLLAHNTNKIDKFDWLIHSFIWMVRFLQIAFARYFLFLPLSTINCQFYLNINKRPCTKCRWCISILFIAFFLYNFSIFFQ